MNIRNLWPMVAVCTAIALGAGGCAKDKSSSERKREKRKKERAEETDSPDEEARPRKPRRFQRTQEQQLKVDAALLTSEPMPMIPIGATFGDNVELIGLDIAPENPDPGATVTLWLHWKVLRPLPKGDWMIGLHLEGPVAGGSVARVIADHYAVEDGPGGPGLYPPASWRAGDIIRDMKTVTLVDPKKRRLGPGTMSIYTTLFDLEAYRTQQKNVRLEITKAGRGTIKGGGDGRLLIATVPVGKKPKAVVAPFRAPELQVRRAPGPIRVDGKLDEPSWRGAVTTGAFRRPDGKPLPATMGTRAKMLWDDTALYVAFLVADTAPTSSFTQRDAHLWKADAVELYLDPGSDHKNYVELLISPMNVVFDALFASRRQPHFAKASKWNLTGLETAVSTGPLPGRRNAAGWTVELRIPWAGLGAAGSAPSLGSTWTANMFRVDAPSTFSRMAAWSAVSDDARADFHNLERAGILRFVDMPEAVRARLGQ